MKLLLLVVGLFLVAVHGAPYGGGDPEYAMVPDVDGGWKLVNINEDPEPENFYNPETDIIFILHTNQNPAGQRISWNDPSWITAPNSIFNANNPTRLTIHGWGGSATAAPNAAVRNALFQHGQYNVITVDWGAGAGSNNYLTARNRVGPTGTVVGRLLAMIALNSNADTRDMSVIGHSLGAHVAGFAGKFLGGNLGSTVLLDPAGPLFNMNNPATRADFTDAIYVESIKTNAGTLGFDQPIGDANFYPNWGSSQPGCGIDLSGACAHARSNAFFAESINSNVGFHGIRCTNWNSIVNRNCVFNGINGTMGGEPVDTGARGVYFMTTNSAAPFAQGR